MSLLGAPMSRIFVSHSSLNNREATALKRWLAENGWNDVFLDVDRTDGITVGTRWKHELIRAVERSEVVIVLLSAEWMRSRWSDREFFLATFLKKRIFAVLLENTPRSELPPEITAEWQFCRLVGQGSTETIRFTYHEAEDEIAFLAEGLVRLREGLRKAGLTAEFFPWPPEDDAKRAPYRGLEPLEAGDAAVFFGRDVEILRGLDALRGMRANSDKKLFIILGASGAGKSSFLRAGLLPRLACDDLHFFPLPPIRPEGEPLFGKHGLARALHLARADLKLPDTNLGDIKTSLREGPAGLADQIRKLQDALCTRLSDRPEGATPPTLVLPVDQAEELFNADAGKEARSFLELIGGALRREETNEVKGIASVPIIVAFTIRSDRYEPLQTARELAGLQSVVFDDLKPMASENYREVILGPAQRASAGGQKLIVEPELVSRLVSESKEGGDALPLLSLTLERLYRDYGSDGDLRLDEYTAMGGLESIVKTEAESVLARDGATRKGQLELLHAAFIPWLATINPLNDQPMRRLSSCANLPVDSLPLINALVERRLLLSDERYGEVVVEVAHEALLRQWDVLANWLKLERENLKDADVLERAVQAWEKSGRKEDWLMEGERLAIAEVLADKPEFIRRLESCREFLTASRQRDDARRMEEERRRQLELESAQELARAEKKRADAAHQLAKEQEKIATIEEKARKDAEASAETLRAGRRKLLWALATAATVAIVAVLSLIQVQESERKANQAAAKANARRLAGEARELISKTGGRNWEDLKGVLLEVLAAARILPGEVDGELLNALVSIDVFHGSEYAKGWQDEEPIVLSGISADSNRIVFVCPNHALRIWDNSTGQTYLSMYTDEEVTAIAISPDGRRIATGGNGGTLRLWDAATGKPLGPSLPGHHNNVMRIAFSFDGQRIVSSGNDATLLLWDGNTGRRTGPAMVGYSAVAMSIAFSPDSQRIVAGNSDGTIVFWDPSTGKPTAEGAFAEQSVVISIAYNQQGDRIASGGADGSIRLWDGKNGQKIGTPMIASEGPVMNIAFSHDSRHLLSAGMDGSIRLWDGRTGRPIGPAVFGHGIPTSVAFSFDDSIVSFGGSDLEVWAGPKAWPNELCANFPLNMTRKEWHERVSPDALYICQCPGVEIPTDNPGSNSAPEICPGKPAESISLWRAPTC